MYREEVQIVWRILLDSSFGEDRLHLFDEFFIAGGHTVSRQAEQGTGASEAL